MCENHQENNKIGEMRSSLCFLRRLQMPFFVSLSFRLGFSKSGLILTPVTGGCLGDDGQTTLGHPHHPLILPWLPPAPCLLYYAGLCYRSCYANELTLKQKISLLRPITHCSSIHLETDTNQTAHTPSTQCCESKENGQIEKYDDSFKLYVCSSILKYLLFSSL